MVNDISRNIRRVAFSFIGLFIVLFIYVSYIQIYEADFLAGHALNRRSVEAAKTIPRGSISDRNGKVLAHSELKNNQYGRTYPYSAAVSHVIGYDSLQYGRAGLENSLNMYLSGLASPEYRLGPISKLWLPKSGNNLRLTLDASIQQAAYQALGNYRGAVVVLVPKTGEILALVSKPGFNPNTIDDNWDKITARPDSPFLNRALQGLYPPGSIIKTIVAETALSEKLADTKTNFICEGSLKIGKDYVLPEANFKAHGKIDLQEALAVSCNVTFGKLALNLGRSKLEKMFERYGFSKPLGSELQEAASRIPDFSKLTDGELAQTGIGQGPLLTNPLRMAMAAAAFANKGVIMKPYLVSKVVTPEGSIIKEYSPERWISPAKPDISETVSKFMETVITEGTGTAARIKGVRVAGKTGTAENPHGAPHAWFIGFAPVDSPEIAIAVMVENGGAGGTIAAPIARQIMLEALR